MIPILMNSYNVTWVGLYKQWEELNNYYTYASDNDVSNCFLSSLISTSISLTCIFFFEHKADICLQLS